MKKTPSFIRIIIGLILLALVLLGVFFLTAQRSYSDEGKGISQQAFTSGLQSSLSDAFSDVSKDKQGIIK